MKKISGSIILVGGILLVIIGSILYLPASEKVKHYDSYGFLSDFGRAFVPELARDYNTAKTMTTFGMIAFIVGLLLTIAGIVFISTSKNFGAR